MAATAATIQPATIGYRKPMMTAAYARAKVPVAAVGWARPDRGGRVPLGVVTSAVSTANPTPQTHTAHTAPAKAGQRGTPEIQTAPRPESRGAV